MLTAPRCRCCVSARGDLVLDLGEQPPSECFPALADPAPDLVAPLRLWLCADCGLAQLADRARLPEEPVGLEPAALAAQRAAALDWLLERELVPPGARVAEFGSPHGGSFAELLADRGMVLAGHDSTPALCGLLGRLGLTAIGARRFPLYGGTVCLVAASGPGAEPSAGRAAAELGDVLTRELAAGVLDADALRGLQTAAARTAGELRAFVLAECARGARVYGYGAASRAVALLNLAGLHDGVLLGIADAAPAKQGSRMPGTRIPVISPAELVDRTPDVVLVFVPELLAQARAALPRIELGGGRWVDAAAPELGRPHRTDVVAPRAAACN
ncbi:MAG TPA: methyltransferase domain-containing protein [Pseudonocardia sp.]|jgi:hypothetical protein|nr:methyltransferase domain-containing protein [Pseudonocardia sp.]